MEEPSVVVEEPKSDYKSYQDKLLDVLEMNNNHLMNDKLQLQQRVEELLEKITTLEKELEECRRRESKSLN